MATTYIAIVNQQSDPTIDHKVRQLFEIYGGPIPFGDFESAILEATGYNPIAKIDHLTIKELGFPAIEDIVKGIVYKVRDGKILPRNEF